MLIYWIFWSVKFYLMLLFFRVALFFTLDYSWIQFRFLIFYMCYDRCANNGYKRFLFKKQLSLFWVITMYVNGGMIPTFLLYKGLGLTNSFWVYVIPGMISAFNMLVIRTYMNGLPDSLEESAQLDGAGYFTIFTKIISPLCKPVYATVALFVAVGQWNSWKFNNIAV